MNRVLKGLIKKVIGIFLGFIPMGNVIVFESHSDYCDNSRALSDYLIGKGLNNKYKIVWLVEKPDNFKDKRIYNIIFIQVNVRSILDKAIYCYYLSRARYAFYSHRSPLFKLNRGETYINLWHGTGLKNVNTCNLSKNFDYVLYSSDYYKTAYTKYLQCKPEHLLPLGNPRTDLLFHKTEALQKLALDRNKKIIIWMPTYRTHKNGYKSFNTKPEQQFIVPIIKNGAELGELNDFLMETGVLLIIKIHPAQVIEKTSFGTYPNIYFLTNEMLEEKGVQLYSLLGMTDALITDYSSVYVDYLLTDKPIGFTIDDMDDYKTGYIFENPLEIMPGKHMKTFQDIKDFILDIKSSKDEYLLKRKGISSMLNKYSDGKTSERIAEYFGIQL